MARKVMSDYALTHDEHGKILNEKIFPRSGLLQKTSFDHPNAIILAGQPGAGKGGLAKVAQLELIGDVVKIDPDELRDFHPQVRAIRNAHPTPGPATPIPMPVSGPMSCCRPPSKAGRT